PDGLALFNELNSGQVFISLTRWGFNFGNDLALVPYSLTPTHAGAIPLSQMSGTTPDAYNFFTGALVANVGTNDQTEVMVKSTVNWTPTGGSASQVYKDSVVISNLNVIDSIDASMYS